jgi:YVTN family beta-propeller protein
MSGTRIAQLTGPRVRFVSPPGAKPGAWATIVGQSLSGLTNANGVVFISQTVQPVVLSADATRIVVRVPAGTRTGAVQVNTLAGSALSPLLFNTDVRSPPLVLSNSITQETAPAAVAVSPDGRKFYVAYRVSNRMSVVRASTLANSVTRPIVGGSPRSIAVSPDGKRIYVGAANIGVLILEAATASEVNRVPLAIDGARDNSQGIAISPDGRLLAVSSATTAGSVTIYSISGDTLTASAVHTLPAGRVPLGVAFAPDGSQAYVAAADPGGTDDSLRVFDPATGALLDEDLVGDMPTAVAMHPNGDLVFVTNQNSGSVSVYNANPLTRSVVNTVLVGAQPTGIAVAPLVTRARDLHLVRIDPLAESQQVVSGRGVAARHHRRPSWEVAVTRASSTGLPAISRLAPASTSAGSEAIASRHLFRSRILLLAETGHSTKLLAFRRRSVGKYRPDRRTLSLPSRRNRLHNPLRPPTNNHI